MSTAHVPAVAPAVKPRERRPGVIMAEHFFEDWVFSLRKDFEKDGHPASFAPSYPKRWGSESRKLVPDSPSRPRSIALSLDESLMAVGCGTDVLIYDVETFRLRIKLKGYIGDVEKVLFSPDGKQLVSSSRHHTVSKRGMASTIRLWDLTLDETGGEDTGREVLAQAARAGASYAAEILSDKAQWSSAAIESAKLEDVISDAILRVQNDTDIENGRVYEGNLPGHHSRSFNKDGSYFLYNDSRDTVAAVSTQTRKELFRLTDHSDAVMWAETSPDGNTIATSSWDRTVKLWAASDGSLLHTLTGATNQNWGGAWSHDGRLVAVGCGDQKVRVWESASGELIHTLEGFSTWVRELAFLPSSDKLAAGSGGTLKIFDLNTGEAEEVWQVGEKGKMVPSFISIMFIAYDAKGRLIFGLTDDRKFAYNGQENVKWMIEHPENVKGEQARYCETVVRRDGNGIVALHFDGAIRFWDF